MNDNTSKSILPLSRRTKIALALFLGFWFVWSQAEHISDFVDGFSEGYSKVRASHGN